MLDSLRHFLLVAETGTFTAAARRAHLAQPSHSASIRPLEERVGARLFHRLPRGARLTAAGEALRPHALAALAPVAAGRRAVEEVEGLRAGEVRLGGGATACTYLLPPLLAAFRRRHPGLKVKLKEGFTPGVRAAVAAGELDLGVAQGGPGEPWREDAMVLVAAPALAAALPREGRRLAPGAPFVSFVAGAATRRLQDAAFPEAELVMELASIASVKGHVRAGLGVALLSQSAVRDDLALGTLVTVDDPRSPIHRLLVLVHPGIERLPPAGRALRALMLEGAVTEGA